jgi:hypothetical protein
MMTRSPLTSEEKQRRQLLLQDYEQWRDTTGSNSRVDFVRERGIALRYLLNCLKWQYEEDKRNTEKETVAQAGGNPAGFPSLVAVTKPSGQQKPASSAVESAICIRMRASSIDIAGDIAPTLLTQLLSTLGALNVL